MANIANPVGWFEIPVNDMERAALFYNSVFGYNLEIIDMGETKMAFFPSDPEKSGTHGSLIHAPNHYVPSDKSGVLIYFSTEDVDLTIPKVKDAGGVVLQKKKQISPEHGYMGLILDSEGNRIALHSQT